MIFQFELKPVEDIQPWGEYPDKHLHWFGFTDGKYRLKINDEYLLNYSEEYKNYCIKKFPESSFDTTFVEYQVSRFWEDIISLFPDVIKSVSEKPKYILDAGYLTNQPKIWICADKEDLIINWHNQNIKVKNIPVWSATQGSYKISKKDFTNEVQKFDKSLISQMNERVNIICQTWDNSKIKVDYEQLKNEQRERSTWFRSRLKDHQSYLM